MQLTVALIRRSVNGEREAQDELLHIYETLGGRDRLRLLNYAIELEGGTK